MRGRAACPAVLAALHSHAAAAILTMRKEMCVILNSLVVLEQVDLSAVTMNIVAVHSRFNIILGLNFSIDSSLHNFANCTELVESFMTVCYNDWTE